MIDRADVVIIGGGVLGLSLAYNLLKRGGTSVTVLEKSYLNSGATGRCGGGARQQWTTAGNIDLMKRSVKLFERFGSETGFNVWFRQGGYLFLAKTPEQVRDFEANVKLQNENDVPSRLLEPREIKHLAPELDTGTILAGAYNATDGILHPFPVIWGYARAVERMGGTVLTFTEAKGIEIDHGRAVAVRTNRGRIAASRIVNACGAWAPEIGRMAGVEFPNKPELHEIIVTEPMRPFLKPAVIPMDTGLYCAQTLRGELVACVGCEQEECNESYSTSFAFMRRISRILTELFPRIGNVRVLRHWAGFYDNTPDTNPILGPVDEVDGFIQFHGFMGHGFMMAPVMGEIMAEWMLDGAHADLMEKYALKRFETGMLETEGMIIG